jgi:hypothetical protein
MTTMRYVVSVTTSLHFFPVEKEHASSVASHLPVLLLIMRSFATILSALSLTLYAFAAHHGNHARRHSDVAVRARGDVLQKRDFDGPFTWYDISVAQ